jgi:hypothetical protein
MSLLLLVVLAILVLAIGFALYTTQGSGVSKRPLPDHEPPADRDPGHEGIERAGVDRGESRELDKRGTDDD